MTTSEDNIVGSSFRRRGRGDCGDGDILQLSSSLHTLGGGYDKADMMIMMTTILLQVARTTNKCSRGVVQRQPAGRFSDKSTLVGVLLCGFCFVLFFRKASRCFVVRTQSLYRYLRSEPKKLLQYKEVDHSYNIQLRYSEEDIRFGIGLLLDFADESLSLSVKECCQKQYLQVGINKPQAARASSTAKNTFGRGSLRPYTRCQRELSSAAYLARPRWP